MVWPADIPTLGTPGPNLSAAGGTGDNKQHDALHLEVSENLSSIMNNLGQLADQATSTVMGRLNNLEKYPSVHHLETGVTFDLDTDVGGYILVPPESAGNTQVVAPTGHIYNVLQGVAADYTDIFTLSGRNMTVATQGGYPILIAHNPGSTNWSVIALGHRPDAVKKIQTSLTWPFDNTINEINFVHNLGSLDVLCLAQGTFDVNGTNAVLSKPISVRSVSANEIQFATYDWPVEARPVRGSLYNITLRTL